MDERRESCEDIIYSEEYRNYLIKYDNDLQGVYANVQPDCVNIINSQFLVAYKRIQPGESIYAYTYNSVPKCFGLMDMTAVEAVGADLVARLPGLQLSGKQVLIGFVDTGIDYTNPLFVSPDGKTRIECIWDQNQSTEREDISYEPASGKKIFNYGREYTGDDINRALNSDDPASVVPSVDEIGHGTFLASVAAGGYDEKNNFIGIAPESGIAVVKLKQVKRNLRDYMLINENAACYGEDDIILGVRYLISKAVELGRPLVICLGLGSSQGDHSGRTNLEQYFDTISGLRGICIVTAGGNELGFAGHYSGNKGVYGEDGSQDMEITISDMDRGFVMEVWGKAPALLRIDVISPTGERLGDISPVQNGRKETNFIYEGTKVTVDNVVVESGTGDQLYIMRFERPSRGIWTVRVATFNNTSGADFDAWIPIHQFLNSDVRFVRPDPDITLCASGNARGSITVSGYNHVSNSLYINSGRGFTRKDMIKPDITAPAVEVYGAFTGNSITGQSLFTRMSGTSVGAALTAGGIALILEWALIERNNPAISTEIIRQMLIRGSRRLTNVEYPSKAWGWGILDLYGAFGAIRYM